MPSLSRQRAPASAQLMSGSANSANQCYNLDIFTPVWVQGAEWGLNWEGHNGAVCGGGDIYHGGSGGEEQRGLVTPMRRGGKESHPKVGGQGDLTGGNRALEGQLGAWLELAGFPLATSQKAKSANKTSVMSF